MCPQMNELEHIKIKQDGTEIQLDVLDSTARAEAQAANDAIDQASSLLLDDDIFDIDDSTAPGEVHVSIKSMTGASTESDGAAGLVPEPKSADASKYLRGDGTWQEVQAGPTEYIKSASVADNTLTLTPSSGDEITLTGGVPSDWIAASGEDGYIQNVPDVLRDTPQEIVFDPASMTTAESEEGKVTIGVKPTPVFTGATAEAGGSAGLVPAPSAMTTVLTGDANWTTVDTISKETIDSLDWSGGGSSGEGIPATQEWVNSQLSPIAEGGAIPGNTSNLVNDGDGESPFVTKAYVDGIVGDIEQLLSEL